MSEKHSSQDIKILAIQINKLKFEIMDLQEKMDILKEEVKGLMIENSMNKYQDEEISVKLDIPHKFDIKAFMYYHPEIAKIYVKAKTITENYIDKADLKSLQELHPNEYNESNIELTPRLTIKGMKELNITELTN